MACIVMACIVMALCSYGLCSYGLCSYGPRAPKGVHRSLRYARISSALLQSCAAREDRAVVSKNVVFFRSPHNVCSYGLYKYRSLLFTEETTCKMHIAMAHYSYGSLLFAVGTACKMHIVMVCTVMAPLRCGDGLYNAGWAGCWQRVGHRCWACCQSQPIASPSWPLVRTSNFWFADWGRSRSSSHRPIHISMAYNSYSSLLFAPTDPHLDGL